MDANRGQWNSKIGFIMAAAGSAIGLGNIWRFPYVAGENGGGAFVLLYIAFVFAIGLPYMYAELSLGRATKKNPVGAIQTILPGSLWKIGGYLGVFIGIGILSFYGVIAGWTILYIYKMMLGDPGGFQELIANPTVVVPLFAFFIFLTGFVVYRGVSEGIERWSKILMPVFFLLLIGIIVFSFTLDGATKGLEFYLKPDFSKITFSTVLAALGQAFFSLSLGMGTMITYGSYISKEDNIITSGIAVAIFDTMIAIMAGLIIFPALFAMGEDPAVGPLLVFVVLPKLFAAMPGGLIVGTIFFILLSVAALTSTISLLEVPVAYVIDEHKLSRPKVVWIVAIIAFILGIPSVLSQGASEFLTNIAIFPESFADPDFLSQMSFLFGDIGLAVGAVILSLFIGWKWGLNKANEEIEIGSPGFGNAKLIWGILIKFVIPLVIFIVLLSTIQIF
ncbi:MAG: sodium-dependent transporter [Calditrichaeota bacterium]|nr:MAG: sodium-dependent transporter [Calditrichota bacterium]MBL1206504.1 sodium-dependent transporter [Calditrichota bacterium]NOG46331.1 sodium-dependent transporter [Calditrichota bacterium]